MQNSIEAKIHSLAGLMQQRLDQKLAPYLLMLGAGASIGSGASSTNHVIDSVLEQAGIPISPDAPIEIKLEDFYQYLDNLSAYERYSILNDHFRGYKLSTGYRHLAKLITSGYLNIILTTNYDVLLEDSLAQAGLPSDDWMVLIVGQDRDDRLAEAATYDKPRVKVLKLHGDLNARLFAFTRPEIESFSVHIENRLIALFRNDVIIVGHSLRDPDLNRCIEAVNGAIWYINPSDEIPVELAGRVKDHKPTNILSGNGARFDAFFAWLRLELLLITNPALTPEESVLRGNLQQACNTSDTPVLMGNLSRLAMQCTEDGRVNLAELCFECAIRLAGELKDSARQIQLLLQFGNWHAQLNHPEEAHEMYLASQQIAQNSGDGLAIAIAEMALGRWWWLVRKSRYKTGKSRIRIWCVRNAIEKWQNALSLLDVMNHKQADLVHQWLAEAKKLLEEHETTGLGGELQFRLKAISGPHDGREWLVSRSTMTIGRGNDQDICLVGDQGVAGRHGLLRMEDERILFEDLNSPVGSYLENQSQRLKGRAELKPGDLIRLGSGTYLKLLSEKVDDAEARRIWLSKRIDELVAAMPEGIAHDLRRQLDDITLKSADELIGLFQHLESAMKRSGDESLDDLNNLQTISTMIHGGLEDRANRT